MADSRDNDLGTASNPQRPPLTEEEKTILESDKIGDTAYSKKWVLSALMHLLKDMKSEGKSTTVTEEEEPTEDEIKKQVDIDPKLEEELCELWDMTMDTDVSKYLLEEDAVDLILEVIIATKSLRKLEICLGILANMACTPDVCKVIVEHPTLSDIVLFHIDNPDVRTLIELSRLISVCLSNKDVCTTWIKSLERRSVVDNLVFILENSLNVELLDGVTEAFDKLLDHEDSILNNLSTSKMVNIICDVYRRTAVKSPQTVEALLHILQLISTTENGVSALASVQDSSNIARIILIESSKYFTPLRSNFPSLVSSCSILNVLMSVEEEELKKFTKKDIKVFSTALSLTEALWECISSNNIDSSERSVYKEYFTVVTDFLCLLSKRYADMEASKDILEKLRGKGEQISRVLNIFDETSNCKSAVERMVTNLQLPGILTEGSNNDEKKKIP